MSKHLTINQILEDPEALQPGDWVGDIGEIVSDRQLQEIRKICRAAKAKIDRMQIPLTAIARTILSDTDAEDLGDVGLPTVTATHYDITQDSTIDCIAADTAGEGSG